jgi:surface protein
LNELPLLDTSNATNFSYAFYGCSSLNELPLLDTSNVTNFSYAWNSCSNLTEIPLLDTSSAINIEGAWAKTNIKDIPTFNFKEVTNGKFAFNASPVSNDSYNKFLKNLADIFDDLQGTSSTRIKFGANTASASGDGKIARNTLLQKWDILDNTTL